MRKTNDKNPMRITLTKLRTVYGTTETDTALFSLSECTDFNGGLPHTGKELEIRDYFKTHETEDIKRQWSVLITVNQLKASH